MNTPLKSKAVLVFTSKRGGLLYWAGSVTAGNWPKRLAYKTLILIANVHPVLI
jgi:hypothetical protein